jgi:gamma-glutamylcyclotransferase (GGCT)/AIG2-like uncharacterized protein YtfP
MKGNTLFFIYGTLRKGGRAHHFMDGAKFVGMGSVEGSIFHVDQYPGLVIDDGGRVIGEVYEVGDSMVPELDRYEGCFESPPHYARVSIEVLLDEGRRVDAQVYEFLQLADSHERIDSGDWFEWLRANR